MRSQLSTWLTRIVINEASARRRRAGRQPSSAPHDDAGTEPWDSIASADPDPAHRAYAGELQHVLEDAVDSLPESYRVVFMLRARALIRRAVTERIGAAAAGAFQFHAPRCDRVVATVLARLEETRSSSGIDSV
jgi:RNA polymerase sigma-70 factor (ECF subfamily)